MNDSGDKLGFLKRLNGDAGDMDHPSPPASGSVSADADLLDA